MSLHSANAAFVAHQFASLVIVGAASDYYLNSLISLHDDSLDKFVYQANSRHYDFFRD